MELIFKFLSRICKIADVQIQQAIWLSKKIVLSLGNLLINQVEFFDLLLIIVYVLKQFLKNFKDVHDMFGREHW